MDSVTVYILTDSSWMQSIGQYGPARVSASLQNVSRQRPAAEEQFLEQTPWANPQHPLHHQLLSAAQRQNSLHSRPFSPFTTPAPPRRVIDNNAITGSASTIAALQSAQNSSVAPTPASGEHRVVNSQESGITVHEEQRAETPSKHNDYSMQENLATSSAMGLKLDNDVPQSPLPSEGPASYPNENQRSPAKARPIINNLGGLSAHQPFTSNAENVVQHVDSLAERNLFATFQPQISRQVSVSTGVEHGTA